MTELPGVGGNALSCTSCQGLWVLGLEEGIHRIDPAPEAFDEVPPHNRETDRRAGLCPYGHGILRRAQTHLDPPFYLERCSICSGIWFDQGEWERVATQGLLSGLFRIWAPSWQLRKQADERAKRMIEEAREKLGPDIFAVIAELGETLRGHPASSQGVALLIEFIRGEIDLDENSEAEKVLQHDEDE
ncbi:MAG: hypothetical protein R3338_03550 [Thermoanaerobaculia bacterium]|nr:hypothetical protein [Thermoanaerobaculia bacterium]